MIRERAQALADQFRAKHDDPQWFDSLYSRAQGDSTLQPWDDVDPNPLLIDWLTQHMQPPTGFKALVVGSGLGDDAEELADWGFQVTAFDISKTAVDWCRERFIGSAVTYSVADLLDPPAHFNSRFDLVLEIYTLQSLEAKSRLEAIENLSKFLAPSGVLLVICRASNDQLAGTSLVGMNRTELDHLKSMNLTEVSFEDFLDQEDPPVRRFRALYSRPQ